jgi:hypothetical protein
MTVAKAGCTDTARPGVALQPGKTILVKFRRRNHQPGFYDPHFRPEERT